MYSNESERVSEKYGKIQVVDGTCRQSTSYHGFNPVLLKMEGGAGGGSAATAVAAVTEERGDGVLRLCDVLTPYDGRTDAAAWWRQLERALDIVPLRRPAAVLPLYLRGAALRAYERMPKVSQHSLEAIGTTLKAAFAPSPFAAMEALSERRWRPGDCG